ncbi:MAG TPA: low molecular weight protein-tyrosine-phosphatase [Thalassobaculum sp.]
MYSILFVCTGNICRSPTAEQVTRVLLERRGLAGVVEVDSAGLYDGHVGEAPDVRARAIAGSHGYDLSGLRAKGFEDEDFDRFDLILGMDRGHVHDLRIRAGRVHRDRVRLFLDYSPDMKGVAVPDPYGRDAEDYRRAFELIEAGCIDLVDALVAAKVA